MATKPKLDADLSGEWNGYLRKG
ncbi:hypothetical protein Tco_0314469, partial [Tanacetum coccineum]